LIRVRLSDGAIVSRRKLDEKPSLVEADGNVVVLPEGAVADWMATGWACVQDSGGHSSALYTHSGRMTMLAADPEVTVYFYDGKTEQPTGSVFDLGSFPAGDVQEFRFRIRNDNATAVTVKSIGLVPWSEFRISNAPSLPYILAPQNFVEVRLHFQATDPAMYSAILSVNSVEVLIRAAINAAAQVKGDIDFGRILRGTSSTHTLQVSNGGYGRLTIQNISTSGDPFMLSKVPSLPLTLEARSSVSVDVTFQPVHSGDYKGWLDVDGHKVSLSGSAYDPPPPQPAIDAGGTSLLSAKQQPLVIRLATASETSGTGTVTMTFQPQMTSATDDASIRFVTGGARVQSFQFAEGDTAVSFGSDKQVLFQTGTTAGTITFTVVLGDYSEVASVQIVPAPISFDSVTAERTPGQITVSIWGFDNSRTAGSLAFQFYNKAGGAIGGLLSADAVKDFQQFFSASPDGGGAFLLKASFPVSGDATAIGSVDVRMANGIDVTHLDRVTVN
jgi:HYDIN/CFA65/VesB-like, Ig-like domain